MLSTLSQLFAFALSVLVVSAATRHLQFSTGSRGKAILGGIVAGIIVSVISDFTFSYATTGWERDIESVIARALVSILLSAPLSFVMTTKRFTREQ
jgi:hypothetical protein